MLVHEIQPVGGWFCVVAGDPPARRHLKRSRGLPPPIIPRQKTQRIVRSAQQDPQESSRLAVSLNIRRIHHVQLSLMQTNVIPDLPGQQRAVR